MTFPTSPTNGQSATINGVVYTYSSSLAAWTVASSTGGNIAANSATFTSTVVATGNITGGNILATGIVSTTGSIAVNGVTNTGGNGVGNIGNSSTYFNTVFAKSTSAQYADLAEYYIADAFYLPGTVVSFGGVNEITLSVVANDARVAGVVSTNPAHVMNSGRDHEFATIVALSGRVPTKVTGTVRKGDMMVSAGAGAAQACSTPVLGTVIGKALEDFEGESGVIEVVIGKL
jgi:hypothetical protein